jgi:hypothetical protein
MSIASDIEVALFTHIEDLTLDPPLAVAWPNVSFAKPVEGYLRVNHMPNISQRIAINSTSAHRRMGVLQLDIFKPKNEGPSYALAAADAVAEWFGTDLKLRSGAVTVRITKSPDVIPAMPDDTHWMVPVVVQYESFA